MKTTTSWTTALAWTATLAVLPLLSGCGALDDEPTPAAAVSVTPSTKSVPVLEQAKSECAPGVVDFQIGDEGQSLSIDMPGQDETGPSLDLLVCVLNEVDTPDAVISRMDSTRALDGMQDATWGDINGSWTYHPDSGLDVILVHDGA